MSDSIQGPFIVTGASGQSAVPAESVQEDAAGAASAPAVGAPAASCTDRHHEKEGQDR